MRLAIITRRVLRGEGQARVNYEIAYRAACRGWQVTLVTSELAPELQAHPNIAWQRVRWSNKYSALVGVWNFARHSGQWLRAHRNAYDVVQADGFATHAPSDVNVVHFVHAAWLRSPVHAHRLRPGLYGAYQWLFSVLNARWEKQAFRQTGTIVAVSERVRQELLQIGVPSEQVQVIVNGVDLEEFKPGAADRKALGLPEQAPLGLFAGDLRLMRKNLDTVLKAMPDVPTFHLAVCGAVQGSPYPALAAKLGVSNRVHFLGFRRDMPDLMRAADMFVFPSRYEACSLVVLEALASGLPVLTAVTAGGAEVLTPECGHVLPDPDDAKTLARTLRAWVDDPQRRQQMGQAARQVAEQHSWERMAAAYLQVYREIAEAHPVGLLSREKTENGCKTIDQRQSNHKGLNTAPAHQDGNPGKGQL